MTTAVSYARFSTDKQDALSIVDQQRVCREFAAREGWELVGEYADEAVSGESIGNRPGVIQAIADAKQRKYDILICVEMLRLARGEDLPPLIKRLKFHGLRIIGVQDSFDSAQAHSRMQAGMAGIIGGEFIDMVRRRTFSALEMRAKSKRPTGGRAYGLRPASASESGQMEVNQAEAEIVREIFQRYAAGDSFLTIASDLNARGVPSPGASWKRSKRRAAGWMVSALRSIICNCIYKGDVVWNQSEWKKDPDSGRRVRVKRPASEWIRYRNDSLQIVPTELWDLAQARQRQRSATKGACIKDGLRRRAPGGGRPPRYLFSGLLRCGICGASFSLADKNFYACSSHIFGAACSNTLRVRRSLVESRILEGLKADLLDAEVIVEIERRLRHALAAKKPKDNSAKIATLRKQIDNLTDAIANGLLASSVALASKLASAETELARLTSEQKVVPIGRSVPNVADRYRALVARLDEPLGRDVGRARAALTDVVGERITLQPDESGTYLWAELEFQATPLLAAVGSPEIMVAGAGFEPATFGL